MPDNSERVVTVVHKADGCNVNVRNDELDSFLAANPGAVVSGARGDTTEPAAVADAQAAEEPVEPVAPPENKRRRKG